MMQSDWPSDPGTNLFLAVAAIVLLLSSIAFVYLLLRRRTDWTRQLASHPALTAIDRQLAEHVPGVWRFIRARFTVQQWHGLELTITATVVVLGFMAFALVAENWTDERTLYQIDQRASTWLSEAMEPSTERFMRRVTRLGDGEVIIAACIGAGILLLFRGLAWHVLTLALAPGIGSAVVVALKAIFGRDRPGSEAAATLGHAFPSGHAFAAMTFYGLLIYFTWRHYQNDLLRVAMTIFLSVIIFMVGLSRVMLRVHWVSDVIGGFTLGMAWLVMSISITLALQRTLKPAFKPAGEAPPKMP